MDVLISVAIQSSCSHLLEKISCLMHNEMNLVLNSFSCYSSDLVDNYRLVSQKRYTSIS